MCEGDGCSECEGGYFRLSGCPLEFIGTALAEDIQLATACENHLLVPGGMLDQSAWWFELREALRREERRIENEQEKRRR